MATTTKLGLVVAATALVSVAATALAFRFFFQDPPQVQTERGATLNSAVLGERRADVVHAPEAYETKKTARYPVLYVLDGETQGAHTTSEGKRVPLTLDPCVEEVENVSALLLQASERSASVRGCAEP